MALARKSYSSRAVFLLGLGVVLLVIGVRLSLIHHFGSDQPYNDQWAAEGTGFLQAPLHGGLNWSSFFWPHGEHRPAVTRFITRGLIVANGGQWDCYVEIVFNLLIYAALLVVAWRAVRYVLGEFSLGLMAVIMVLFFAEPCAYENLLWGFQSSFVFSLFCGLFHVFGTFRTTRMDAVWWCAQLVGFCGLFSIAAGMMSAATLVALACVELLRGRRDAWVWFTLVVNAALVGYGIWLLPAGTTSSGNPWNHLTQTLVHAGYLLSWPLGGSWWGLLLQVPFLGAFISWCRRKDDDPQDRMVAVMGIWVAFVACAIGYGRMITPQTIGGRYYDVLILSAFFNALYLVKCLARPKPRWNWPWSVLGVCWVIAFSVGFWRYNNPDFVGAMLRQQKTEAREQGQVLREFLRADDPRVLEDFEQRTHRFPHFEFTLALLRDEQVQPLLPPSLSTSGRVGPLSRLAPMLSGLWDWVMAGGFLLLVLGIKSGFRNRCEGGRAVKDVT